MTQKGQNKKNSVIFKLFAKTKSIILSDTYYYSVFLASFIFSFAHSTSVFTDYPISKTITKYAIYTCYCFLLLRILFGIGHIVTGLRSFFAKNKVAALTIILFLVLFGVSFIVTRNNKFLLPVLLAVSLCDVDIKKLLKLMLLSQVMCTIVVVLASFGGILQDYTIGRIGTDTVRHSFGFDYVSCLPRMLLFSSILGIYLYGFKLKSSIWYLLTEAINIVVFMYTDSKAEFILLTAVMSTMILIRIFKKNNLLKRVTRKILAAISKVFWILPVLSVAVCLIYRPDGMLLEVNKALSNRLSQTQDTINAIGVNPIGSRIRLLGNGLMTKTEAEKEVATNYIDNEYLQVYVYYGIFASVLFVVLVQFILDVCRRNNMQYELASLLPLCLFALINASLISLPYSPVIFISAVVIKEYLKKTQVNNV